MPDVINVGKNAMDVRKAVTLLPYSKVIINVEQVDSDTVVSYEAGNDTGITLEFDCPWGTQAMADSLLEKIRGYQYQPYEVTTAIVNPAAEMGDAVQTNGVYGGIYQQDSQFGHTFYSDFSAPQDEQLDHEFTFESPIERRLARQEAKTKSEFKIQHDNIEARVTQEGGDIENESFSWRLLSNEFGLYSGTKKVFKCDKYGITVDGEIKARTGYIGSDSEGFVINSKSIYNGMTAYDDTAHDGVYVGTDGIGLGKANFTVKPDGTFSAKKGTIGSDATVANRWQIGEKDIHKGTNSISSNAEGVYLGTDGLRIYKTDKNSVTLKADGTVSIMKGMTSISDTTNTTGFFLGDDGLVLGGGKLKLEKDGTLTAKKGVIGSDTNAWNIGAKSIYNGVENISDATHDGTYVGIDGVRVFKKASGNVPNKGCTFKATGDIEILGGMTSMSDTTNTTGFYFSNNGLVFGGGKLKLEKDGTLTAKKGVIGSDASAWNIGAKSIYNGVESLTDASHDGTYVGIDGVRVFKKANGNVPNKGCTFKASGDFEIMNGLTGHSDIGSSKSGLYIDNSGITLGGGKFVAKNDGTVRITTGHIGSTWNAQSNTWNNDGFDISSKSINKQKATIDNVDNADGVYIGTNGISLGRIAKEDVPSQFEVAFKVKSDGSVVANNIEVRGKLGGSSGFTVKNGKFYIKQTTYDGSASGDTAGVYVGTDGIGLGAGKFYVTSGGKFYAREGYIGDDDTVTNRWVIGRKDIHKGKESYDGDAEGVYIGTDGIGLGKKVDASTYNKFYVKANGDAVAHNIEIKGKLGGSSGFTVTDGKFYSGSKVAYNDDNNGVHVGTSGIGLGAGKFYVSSTGELTAKSATLTGTVTAKEGRIGADANGANGFVIKTNYIHNNKDGFRNTSNDEGVYVGNSGISLGRILKEGSSTEYENAFEVTSKGILTARGVKIKGEINATSGTFDNVTIDNATIKSSCTFKGTLDGASGNFSGKVTAKEGTIGSDSTEGNRWQIGAKSIYNGTSEIDNTTQGVYLGTNGVRIYQSDDYNYTFGKSSNTFGIMAGKKGIGLESNAQTTGVFIGTTGIALGRTSYTLNGNTVYCDAFSVSSNGSFTARSGQIGNGASPWTIGNNSIWNGKNGFRDIADGVYIGYDGISIGQNEAKPIIQFQGTDIQLEALRQQEPDLIDVDSIYHTYDNHNWYCLADKSAWMPAQQSDMVYADPPLQISRDGKIKARNVELTGKIKATDGMFMGTVSAAKLVFIDENGSTVTISGSHIGSGINGANINRESIGNDQLDYNLGGNKITDLPRTSITQSFDNDVQEGKDAKSDLGAVVTGTQVSSLNATTLTGGTCSFGTSGDVTVNIGNSHGGIIKIRGIELRSYEVTDKYGNPIHVWGYS